ncbi:MAG: hypothetical protein KIT31_33900 [Deltaproteobacteria bacterium]|nr:hypothetical protein [Deltaproteobacteria bacterium]
MRDAFVHPAWFVALVLAARYGARGLVAVPAVAVGLAGAALLAERAPLAVLDRVANPEDLFALAAIAVIAWIGGMHEARKAALETRLRDETERAAKATGDLRELAEAALALRERGDRMTASLTYLADIAGELDSGDPVRAGRAALELALARTGARAGAVQVLDGAVLKTLASSGTWGEHQLAPPVLYRDRVAAAAVQRGTTVAAHEVAEARVEDSDLAAPIHDEHGAVRGTLALRGLPHPTLASTVRVELAAIARWAARSVVPAATPAATPVTKHRTGSARASL